VDVLLQHIKKRGRSIEQQISADYLTEIQEAYFEYLKSESETPVVILDLGGIDFQRDTENFNAIMEVIQAPHPVGVKRISL
jgi:deoxyadenosine/deoxycytidine kinase